ncbi:MAG: immunoglobulin domain-containing protein [Chitinivibrionales bacterium]|nr:immunoglobulin domain-containing protein [Chitinivibrionales bacterium]
MRTPAVKVIFLSFLVVSVGLAFFLFCADPIDPQPNDSISPDKAAVSLIVPENGQGASKFKPGEQVTVRVKVEYPKFVDTVFIEFGEADNPNNKQLYTELINSNQTVMIPFSITFRLSGTKDIKVTAKLKKNAGIRNAQGTVTIITNPTIFNREILCWPKVPVASQPCSLWVEIVKGTEGTGLQFTWFKDNALLSNQSGNRIIFISLTKEFEGTYTCYVTNSSGADTSKPFKLETITNPKPVITLHPVSIKTTPGSKAVFSCRAEPSTVTGQWYRNNQVVPGATQLDYTITSVALQDNGALFRCHVANGKDTAQSKDALLTVSETAIAPKITKQPENKTANKGEKVVFSVEAEGTNLEYQWKRNNEPIPAATKLLYEFVATEADDGVKFRCAVSNSLGNDESTEALLTVKKTPDVVKPVITSHPSDVSTTEGGEAVFTVVATGAELVYQWMKNSSPVSGAVSAAYKLSPVAKADNDAKFKCVVSNSAGKEESKEATLRVVENVLPPTITNHPSDVSATEGGEAVFTVVATGTNLQFQWMKNGSPIPGAVSATYKLSPVTKADNESKFKCFVSNSAGKSESQEAVLKVAENIIPPGITKHPENKTGVVGEKASFVVEATGTNLTYQWKKGTQEISGATMNTYTTGALVKEDNNATYTCMVKNSAGSKESNPATLSVHYIEFKKHPQNQEVEAGKSVSFSVEVESNPSPRYQWLKGGSDISGATSAAYTIQEVKLEDNNQSFSCKVSLENSQLTQTSQAGQLKVKDGAITITAHPQSKSVKKGETVTFTVAATGTSLKYQWQKNGSNIGTDQNTLSFAAEKGDNNTSIKCIVSNSSSKVESNLAIVTVEWEPVIRTHPQNQEASISSQNPSPTATFSITMEDEGNPKCTYQWYYNNTPFPSNGNAPTVRVQVTTAMNGMQFYCVAKNFKEVKSNTATLAVYYTGTVAINLNKSDFTEDESITYSATTSGWNPEPTSFVWTYGSQSGSQKNGSFAAKLNTTQIRCVATNKAGSAESSKSVSVKSKIVPPGNVTLSFSPGQSVDENTSVTITCNVGSGTEPFTYSWSGPSAGGSTNKSISFTATTSSAGGYQCRVTNDGGSASSDLMTLTVKQEEPEKLGWLQELPAETRISKDAQSFTLSAVCFYSSKSSLKYTISRESFMLQNGEIPPGKSDRYNVGCTVSAPQVAAANYIILITSSTNSSLRITTRTKVILE